MKARVRVGLFEDWKSLVLSHSTRFQVGYEHEKVIYTYSGQSSRHMRLLSNERPANTAFTRLPLAHMSNCTGTGTWSFLHPLNGRIPLAAPEVGLHLAIVHGVEITTCLPCLRPPLHLLH